MKQIGKNPLLHNFETISHEQQFIKIIVSDSVTFRITAAAVAESRDAVKNVKMNLYSQTPSIIKCKCCSKSFQVALG